MNRNVLKAIGPGLIWAGAAIGVSHLVQSTRAGADYGLQLVGIVLLANLFKYPFFQFGPRYAIATGESLIEGYHRMGKWVVVLFLLLTIGTMFSILAAVTSVTVGIIGSVLPPGLSEIQITVILFVVCSIIILIGRYKTLDRLMKGVIVVLALSTLLAFVAAVIKTDTSFLLENTRLDLTPVSIAFIVALVGWMPSAIDISVWNSLWTLAKTEQSGYRPSLKEVLLDFNIGYVGTVIFSLAFLGLGAAVMYNSGESFASGGVGFANQFFDLYTRSIGKWAYAVIAVAAIATMFSTSLTILDAYPRVLNRVLLVFKREGLSQGAQQRFVFLWVLILVLGATLLINHLKGQMKVLVDFATTLSFITAPVLAYLNLKAITAKQVPKAFRPGKALLLLSWTGIVVLAAFAVYFLFVL